MVKPDRDVRLPMQTIRVLEAFLDPAGELAGAVVRKRTGLSSGTLYPTLLRLERAGWIVSRWESRAPPGAGRLCRRLYRLTPLGSWGLARTRAVLATFGQGVLT